MNLHDAIKSPKATIIDVRTPDELYNEGVLSQAINIPLDSLMNRLDYIKTLSKPLVFVCRSGNRSSQAVTKVISSGIKEVYDGGAWKEAYLHLV